VTVDHLGYAIGMSFALVLLWFAARERRWWSWLQLAGIGVLVATAVGADSFPEQAESAARLIGPGLLVGGLVAWRLHWDAGWFGGDELRPPPRASQPPRAGQPHPAGQPEPDREPAD
jgi:hypothetical protein